MAGWYRTPQNDYPSPRRLIPLIAVTQATKAKVRPVIDYREINQYVDASTANAGVCDERMKE